MTYGRFLISGIQTCTVPNSAQCAIMTTASSWKKALRQTTILLMSKEAIFQQSSSFTILTFLQNEDPKPEFLRSYYSVQQLELQALSEAPQMFHAISNAGHAVENLHFESHSILLDLIFGKSSETLVLFSPNQQFFNIYIRHMHPTKMYFFILGLV